MANHRYWRFLINSLAVSQGNIASIAEVGAAITVGGANGLTGSTASASSTLGGFVPANVLDGNQATIWASNTAAPLGEWIKFDLGAGNEKDLSAEMWLNGSSNVQTPTSGSWQWSDDNVGWTTALTLDWRTNFDAGMTIYTPDLVGSYLDAYKKISHLLTGRNLVATSSGAGGVRASRDIRGPIYFEATITTLTGVPQVGLAPMQWNHTTALGTGTDTIGYQPSGAVRIGNVTLQTIAGYAAGNRIGVAVDPQSKLIWFRVNGGNWNNNAANNPATGVGGIDYSALLPATGAGTLFPAVSASLTGNVWTTAFLTFVDAAPAGFATLDAATFGAPQTGIADLKTLEPMIPGAQIPTPPSFAMPSIPPVQRYFTPAGAITKVSGLTEEAGVIVAGRLVEVFDRVSGDRLDYTYSAVDGTWSLVCLGRPSVRIVGSDPTTYNSVVYDNVVPV